MSHEIATTVDGRFAMAYLDGDAAPWHAAETNPSIVPANMPIEVWFQAAGLDYSVAIAPHFRADGSQIENSNYIYRMDTSAILGPYIAGQWKPVQNLAALALAERLAAKHGYKIVTAGALFDGATIWVQMETSLAAELPGEDHIVDRPLFVIRHTGTDANTFGSVKTRVVCNNTLTAALMSSDADMVRHDHRLAFDLDVVEAALVKNEEQFGDFTVLAQQMARTAMTDATALDFFRTVFGGKEKVSANGEVQHSVAVRRAMAFRSGQDFVAIGQKAEAEVIAEVDAAIDRAARAAGHGAVIVPSPVANDVLPVNPGFDMESARGTVWGGFNTVSWLADQRPAKNRGASQAMASHLMGDGTGGRHKARAWNAARELISA